MAGLEGARSWTTSGVRPAPYTMEAIEAGGNEEKRKRGDEVAVVLEEDSVAMRKQGVADVGANAGTRCRVILLFRARAASWRADSLLRFGASGTRIHRPHGAGWEFPLRFHRIYIYKCTGDRIYVYASCVSRAAYARYQPCA